MLRYQNIHLPLFRNSVATAAFGLVALNAAAAAHAQNLLTNGSFEAGTYVDNHNGGDSLSVGSTSITGWTTTNNELAWLKTGDPYNLTPEDGTFFLDLTGYHDSPSYGGLTQTIATTIGGTYSLSFYLGAYQSDPASSGPMGATASAGSTSQDFTFTPGPSAVGNVWQAETMTFTATAATTAITITGTHSGGGNYIGLDNASVISVGASAPEPGSLGLLVWISPITLFGVVRYRRRHSRHK